MFAWQYRKVADIIDSILSLIQILSGFPSDIPFAYSKSLNDSFSMKIIKNEIISIFESEKQKEEFKNNPDKSKKLENLIKAILECLE